LLPKRIGLNHPEAIAKALLCLWKWCLLWRRRLFGCWPMYRVLLDILKIRPSSDGKILKKRLKLL
jgi:putative hemolysin